MFFQYKDAFFTANPDFKWYKLPAPPLRTLTSRPRDHHPPPLEYEPEVERTNNNSTKLDLNKKPVPFSIEDKSLSMFTPGKLADEAQMGGLSSLLAIKTDTQSLNPYYSPPSYKYNQISFINDTNVPDNKGSKDENIKELQNALSETTRMFENFDDREGKVYYNDQFTNQDVINQIVDKRYSKDDESDFKQNTWTDFDEQNLKSGRTCKGKRYQEFMAVGGLIVNKRPKRETDRNSEEAFNASCSWEPDSYVEETVVTDDTMHENYTEIDEEKPEESTDAVDTVESDMNGAKSFKASDFDLDAKIKALPSLSLEKFQERKRENKRKKKMMNIKPKMERNSEIINSVPIPIGRDDRRDMVEKWRENVIGSQKRKPRKISITRLEINSLAPSVNLTASNKISPEIKIATEAPNNISRNFEMRKQSFSENDNGGDLFALATLAEVAANTSKMEETTIFEMMAAKAREGNASTV